MLRSLGLRQRMRCQYHSHLCLDTSLCTYVSIGLEYEARRHEQGLITCHACGDSFFCILVRRCWRLLPGRGNGPPLSSLVQQNRGREAKFCASRRVFHFVETVVVTQRW